MESITQSAQIWAQLNALCDQFEDAWLSGALPRAEDYLVDVPEQWIDEASRELVKLDLHYRRAAGLPDDTADYSSRFPRLDRLWLQQILNATSSLRAESSRMSFPPTSSTSHSRLRPVLPGYEILELLGRGGMGVVYKARQLDLDRLVAIKMILAGEFASPETVARFRSEARAVAQLQHPNLVQIFDVGEFNGRLFLTFEYVEGGSLEKRLNGVPQLPKPSAKLLKELSHATQFAHNRSIVHRDLKPSNVLLATSVSGSTNPDSPLAGDSIRLATEAATDELLPNYAASGSVGFVPRASEASADFGQPKIADFGLAKDLNEEGSHTRTGAILGSPCYMAPEQASGVTDRIGPACDVYALGSILYEMLTGRPPFRAHTVADTLDQVRHQEPIPPRRLLPSIPRDLETICLKCLQKDPTQRYESAGALADDLDRYLRDEPVLARPVSRTERSYRWCRRHPLVALLLALLALVTSGGMTGIIWQWKEANQQREFAELNAGQFRSQRDTARQQQVRAETNQARAERSAYFHRIGQAQGEWESNQAGRAVQRLDECPSELRGWEWNYLRTVCQSELLTLKGHTDEAWCVDFSADGKTIISGSGVFAWKRPGEIMIWDGDTGQQKKVLKGHDGPILDIDSSADGSRFATCSSGFEDSGPGRIKIWTGEGQLLHTLPDPGTGAFAIALSRDGRLLASGGFAPQVLLWNAETGTLLKTLSGHTSNIFGMQFSPDGRSLASVGNDGTVRVWSVGTGQPASEPLTGFGNLRKVIYSPDGRYLAFSSHSNDLYIADLSQPAEVPKHYLCPCGIISALSYSAEGRRLAVSSFDGNVLILDPLTGRELRRMHTHDGAVNGVSFGDHGRRLVTVGMDRLVKVWDGWTDGNAHETNLSQASKRGNFFQMAVSPDGQKLLLPNGMNRFANNSGTSELLIWDLNQRRIAQRLPGHTQWLTGVAISRDGAWYATSSADKTARVWNAATGKSVHELRGHADVVTCVDLSADSRTVVTGCRDGTARLWNRESGALVHELHGAKGRINRVSLQPSGETIAGAVEDGTILLWNTDDGTLKETLRGHLGAVTALAYSHHAKFLASGGDDQTVRIWNGPTGEMLHVLHGHTATVSDIAFSPDDRRLGSAAADHTVKLWEPQFGDEAFTLHLTDKVMAMAFHPDGKRIYASHHAIVRNFDATQVRTSDEKQAAFQAANLRWHRQQATESLKLQIYRVAQFHCDRWAELEPNSQPLKTLQSTLKSLELSEAVRKIGQGLLQGISPGGSGSSAIPEKKSK